MQLDDWDTCDLDALERIRWMSMIGHRISAIERRFPLASRGLLSILDQAIFSGTSFITAVVIGRTTSPDSLGIFYLVLSVILIVSGVQDQVVASPYDVYSKRRHGLELVEFAGSIWAHHFAITAIAVLSLLIAACALWITGKPQLIPLLTVLLATAPLMMLRQGIRRFTTANFELKAVVALDSAIAVMQLGGLGALIYLRLVSLFSIFAVIATACGLACAGYLWSKPPIRFVRARILPDWHHNWRFGKWALQTYALGNMTPQLMLWIVGATVGSAATGVFGACNSLIGVCYVILCGLANVLTPLAAQAFATGGVKELRRILRIAGAFYAITMGGLCLFVMTTGDWLVVFAFGSHYQGTGPILMALTLSTAMNAWSMLTGNGLWAIEQPRANFLADVCCMTVVLVAAAALVVPYGALGAALATLAGTSTAAVVRCFTLMSRLEGQTSESNVAISSALSS
jgi:O-antigen/teichoic acid export membrane protein